MATIEFWYEFASTYSYPAAMRIEDIAHKSGLEVLWKPFLLGPIFKAQGWNNSPFNIYPAKGAYMWRDVERICNLQGLPFTRPEIFPQNGLLAARLALCLAVGKKRASFTKNVYLAAFSGQQDISTVQTMSDILQALDIEPATALEEAQSREVKNQLRHNTELAVEKQIFGAPTFVTKDGEMFWGNDRLEQAVAWQPG